MITKPMAKNDTLQTPQWIVDNLGAIDLDPCAGENTSIRHRNLAIERGEDGLSAEWDGFVYCNPPFSQKEAWIGKMVAHGNGILILPERGSAPWFGALANAVGRYWVMGKKINFVGGSSSNNVGSVMFLFGDEAKRRVLNSNLPGHMVKVYRPRRVGDLDNRIKCLQDAMEGFAYDDDKQISSIFATRHDDKENPRVEVIICDDLEEYKEIVINDGFGAVGI